MKHSAVRAKDPPQSFSNPAHESKAIASASISTHDDNQTEAQHQWKDGHLPAT